MVKLPILFWKLMSSCTAKLLRPLAQENPFGFLLFTLEPGPADCEAVVAHS
jgi:hypothetical protein